MKRRQKTSYIEISTKGKVSIPGDMAHADEAFGPFPSPTHLPSLQQLKLWLPKLYGITS